MPRRSKLSLEKNEGRRQLSTEAVNRRDDGDLGDVMVVGGGISGIQAALDLATSGFKVFLVERAPTIGGKMAQLDKTFPTNDCSMCIESPKFIECDRHPNIEILTYTEVDDVEGEAGDFTISLTKKARYISEDKCTGCTTCVEYCPVEIPDPFNQELSSNKAVHIYFSQAVPLVPYIDESCIYLKEQKCSICEGVCKTNAIDLHQKPEKLKIKVGAVVLSPGYEVFDPRVRGDYGYGQIENVVTSLDFERLLCATGPHEGEILRPSDKKHPHKIAWIHCVGSRQVLEGANSYCSSVCCTYIQKQVILAKDHDADTQATIFHNDIRSYGKDFERFYQRAENLPGVRFVRSYVSIGREIPETKNVTIRYATDAEGVKEDEFDLVVLGVGLAPPTKVNRLAEQFGIELNAHGFCKTNPVNPIETTRPGVFVSGAFQGPIDIPESVMSASGTNALTGALLRSRRGRSGQGTGLSAGTGCVRRGRQGWGLCLSLRRQHRQSGRYPIAGRILEGSGPMSRTRRKASSSAPRTLRNRSRTRFGRRGSTAWSSPPAPRGPTNRCSGTPFVKGASTSTSSTWPISGSTAPGCTPSRRKKPPGRPRTSSACRLPAQRSIWSPSAFVCPRGRRTGVPSMTTELALP